MASFYREKSGKWTCAYMCPQVDGSTKRVVKRGFDREKDAKSWHEALAGSIALGLYVDAGKLTVTQWFSQYLNVYCKALAPSTRTGYRISVEKHIVPVLGAKKLKDLQPVHIQKFINDLSDAKYKPSGKNGKTSDESGKRSGKEGNSSAKGGRPYNPSSIHQIYRCLKGALERAVADGLLARNPCAQISLPAKAPPKRAYCTAAQVNAVLSVLAESKYFVPITICAMTGLRRGEALGLKWDDIDWTKKTASIARQVVVNERLLLVSGLKTASSSRIIALSDDLAALLKRHKKTQALERLAAGSRWQEQGFICTDASGNPLRPDAVSRAAKNALDKVAPGKSLHDLRHTFATLLLQSGVRIDVVSMLLGHSQVQTTYSIYIGKDESAKAAAAETIGGLLTLPKQKRS